LIYSHSSSNTWRQSSQQASFSGIQICGFAKGQRAPQIWIDPAGAFFGLAEGGSLDSDTGVITANLVLQRLQAFVEHERWRCLRDARMAQASWLARGLRGVAGELGHQFPTAIKALARGSLNFAVVVPQGNRIEVIHSGTTSVFRWRHTTWRAMTLPKSGQQGFEVKRLLRFACLPEDRWLIADHSIAAHLEALGTPPGANLFQQLQTTEGIQACLILDINPEGEPGELLPLAVGAASPNSHEARSVEAERAQL
jgi:hypothetical protein